MITLNQPNAFGDLKNMNMIIFNQDIILCCNGHNGLKNDFLNFPDQYKTKFVIICFKM